jgi:hypothetical protein
MIEPPGDYPADPSLPVAPTPGTAKTIGTLNIIFACILLLCGGCASLQLIAQSALAPLMDVQRKQMQQAFEAERLAQIGKLEQAERAATSNEEKTRLQQQRKALEAQKGQPFPDMTRMWGMSDPRVLTYFITDLGTAATLNVAMLVAGIGLVNLKEWGRKLGIWVAGLKVLRLVALYGFSMAVIVPIVTKQTIDVFEEMSRAVPGTGGPAPQQFGQMAAVFGVMMTVGAVGMMLLGAIYPAICLILLTRPRVKAACNLAPLSGDGYYPGPGGQ